MVREVDRRSVLKRVGAAGVVGAGLATGTASACEGNELLDMSSNQMAGALEEHAMGVMEELSAEGLIAEPTPTALPLEPVTVTELGMGMAGAAPVRLNGNDTIVVQKFLDDAWLRMFTDITVSDSYAVYDTLGDTVVTVIEPNLWNEVDLSDQKQECDNECFSADQCDGDSNSGLWEGVLRKSKRSGGLYCDHARVLYCNCVPTQTVPDQPYQHK